MDQNPQAIQILLSARGKSEMYVLTATGKYSVTEMHAVVYRDTRNKALDREFCCFSADIDRGG